MKKIKVYIAGKVEANSVFKTFSWRQEFCSKLSEKTGCEIVNLDPVSTYSSFQLDETNSQLIFGRDCFLISSADLVIVYLTDDISVGGSQEMLIAKYYNKPLIGIVRRNGKFVKDEAIIGGRLFKNHTHPFVKMTCDRLVFNEEELAEVVKEYSKILPSSGLSIINSSREYYINNYFHRDSYVNSNVSEKKLETAQKGIIVDKEQRRLLVIKFYDSKEVPSRLRGKLSFPGGRIRFGERQDDSFRREVEEETGIKIKAGRPITNYQFNFCRHSIVHQIFAVARFGFYQGGEIAAPKIKEEYDLEKAVWIDVKELNSRYFAYPESKIIDRCRKSISKYLSY